LYIKKKAYKLGQTKYKIFDIHTHTYPEAIADKAVVSLGNFYEFNVEGKGTYADLVENGREFGVCGYLLFSVATNGHQVEKVNNSIAALAAASREAGYETVGFAGIHQDFPDFAAEIDRAETLGLRGVKIHPDIQRLDLDSPRMYELCEIIEGRMPLYLHMGDCRPQFRYSEPKKLARLLGISRPAAVGHLHFLWWWALDFAQDGVLDKYDAADLAEAMEWKGDEQALLDALIESGYVDDTELGIVIHDWGVYAGKLLERRAKDRARKRAAAEEAGVPKTFRRSSAGKDAEVAKNLTDSFVTNQPTNSTNQPTVQNRPTEGEPTKSATPPPDPTPYAEIVALYHEICSSFSRLRNVSDKRKKAIAARWKEYGNDLDTFRELFSLAEASDFLKGKNAKNWTADFDWLLNSANMAKVLEGKYNDKPKGGEQRGQSRGHSGEWNHRGDQTTEATLSGFRMADG
jgi:hypothetical protein